jgi:hypothetical protein
MPAATLLRRRSFLQTLAAGSSTIAATELLEWCASATGRGPPPIPNRRGSSETVWDKSWLNRITAEHRVVFNVMQIMGLAVGAGKHPDGRVLAG